MSALYSELINGPLASIIAAPLANADVGAIYELLHKKNIPAKGIILSHDIKQYFSVLGLRLPIKDSTSLPCREVSQALEDFDTFDLGNPVVLAKITADLTALVNEPLVPAFTMDNLNYILSMGDILINRASQIPDIDTSLIALGVAIRGGDVWP